MGLCGHETFMHVVLIIELKVIQKGNYLQTIQPQYNKIYNTYSCENNAGICITYEYRHILSLTQHISTISTSEVV